MPVVGIPVDLLTERLGGGIEPAELVRHLHALGCDVEGFAELRRYRCVRCSNILETTPTEAAPSACDRCGTAFGDAPDLRVALGTVRALRMELLAVRPDMFDPAGLARALRGFLGRGDGSPDYPLERARLHVEVDPALGRPESFRPAIACGVIRGAGLDEGRIKVLMKLQENLHWALGRDRRRASIGVYDLATLGGTTFRYRTTPPGAPAFVPLGFAPDQAGGRLTPEEVLARHPKGRAYAHLLEGWPVLPLLEDETGRVMALIPVINSEETRVRTETRDLFIDVTGPEARTVSRTLNVFMTSLLELDPRARGERVSIRGADGRESETPDLSRQRVIMAVGEASRLVGPPLAPEDEPALLARMGHRVARDGDRWVVDVPAWRADVLHARDLVEDAAIAFGYDRLHQGLVETQTVGQPLPAEEVAARARAALTGLGHLEVMTLPLTAEAIVYDALGLPRDEGRVIIANPVSVEQTMVRTDLWPGLLATLALNTSHEMPQRIFEVGLVSRLDAAAETGASERRRAAAAVVGRQVGFADARTLAEAFLAEFGRGIDVEPLEHGLFLPGRGARVIATRSGAPPGEVGLMGEIHPAVLERFRLVQPGVILEVDLTSLTGLT